MMYSADSSSSSSVADMPRLSSTGFRARPAIFSNEKFCMLRAPIWMQSAYLSTSVSASLSIASVTMGRSNSSRMRARISSPCSPSPWNDYGAVRGGDGVGLQAHLFNVADDGFDLIGPGAGLHDYEHRVSIIERFEAPFRE